MVLSKKVMASIDKLKEEDFTTLSHLYLYRAIDIEQLMRYVYDVDTSIPSGKGNRTRIVNRLVNEGVVTKTEYQYNRFALQITNKGIDAVRYERGIPKVLWNNEDKSIKKGYYTAASLKLSDRLINHQVHLNQFMFEFGERVKDFKLTNGQGLTWNYFDEKHNSKFVGMRPDGIITFLDTDFFIETDMATESKKQLEEKWMNYRRFMNSSEFIHKERKIVVLFVLEGIIESKKLERRKQMVKSTINDKLLDKVSGDFEIIVGSRKELISYIFESFLPEMFQKSPVKNSILSYFKKHGYSTSYGFLLNEPLNGDFYEYYIRQLDENGDIIFKLDEAQEFFLDFYEDYKLSVLHKIAWFEQNAGLFEEHFHRRPKLIVVVDDMNRVFEDFRIIGRSVLGVHGIYFISLSQFDKNKDIYENLLQLGSDGEVYKMDTVSLNHRSFIYKIGEKTVRQKEGRI